MENKQTLIFIQQKNRTDDVLSIKPGIEGKIKVRYTNNKEYYYNKEDVEEYQFLEKLPVENYQFSRSGYGAYNNVISVEKYSYLEKNKIKVCFEHGKNVILNQENFKIEQSALFEKKANDVFEYLKKLANLNNIKSDDGSSLLGKNYERVTFVSQQSVLHRFLSASSTKSESESKSDDQSLIFPFGCNNSQLIATEKALKNQISFIEGPPGTGKTQTILNILSNIIYRNQTALVVSNNNSAIANIKEKLSQPEIALDFLTATLGSKQNKEKFLKNQSFHYPNYLPDILENKERNLKFELVKKAFSLKEEIANIKSQISFIEIEYQHFQDYMSDKDLFEVDLSKLSPKVLLDLLLECERIFEQNRKIGFIFKIKSIFKYKIRNFSFYKQNPDFLAATIQKKFYETELEKLNKKLSKLENDYETNLGDEYIANMIEYSKSILKSALLEKYIPGAPRKVNNTDNSAKNRLTHFTDDPHLLNVAVSRAKNQLILVTSGNKQKSNMNITDLIDYIAYQNCDIKDSMVRSVFDYLYKQYEERRLNYFKNRSKHSKYDSENLMFELLKEILTSYSELDFITQYRLKYLIKDFSLLSSDEATFVNQSRTSVDFLIFNKVTKVPVLAIEVDGVKYHNNPDQMKRDSMKNNIFKNYQLPLLRLATNGSGEEEKIRIALADYKSTDEIIQSKDMINNI